MDSKEFIARYGPKDHDKTYAGYIWSALDLDSYGEVVYKTKGTEDDAYQAAFERGFCGDRSQTFCILDPEDSQDLEIIKEFIEEAETL